MNHLMDGGHRVLVSALLTAVHCYSRDQYLLLFDPQQSRSRRDLRDTSQGNQLSNFLYLHSSYPQKPNDALLGPKVIYAKDTQSLCISVAETLVHTGRAWDISLVCSNPLNLSRVLDSLSTAEEQIGKEEKK